MTESPTRATVLNTTVLSNFAQVDHVEVLLTLPRVVTVAAVRDELEAGTETHPYINHAVRVLGDEIPVIAPAEMARTLEATFLETLDPGEAQALAVAESTDGMVVTAVARRKPMALAMWMKPTTGNLSMLVATAGYSTVIIHQDL